MIETIDIVGQSKEGFWVVGFFIVPSEKRAYYKDSEEVWRYVALFEDSNNGGKRCRI